MIKIETVYKAFLKRIHNFHWDPTERREEYHYSASGVSFNQISYDSRRSLRDPLFVKGGQISRRIFGASDPEQRSQWYVLEQDFEVNIPAIIVTDIKPGYELDYHEFYNTERQLKLLSTGTKGKTTSAYPNNTRFSEQATVQPCYPL